MKEDGLHYYEPIEVNNRKLAETIIEELDIAEKIRRNFIFSV